METEINFFSEDMVDDALSVHQHSDAYFSFLNDVSPKGDDEEEDEAGEDESDNTSGDNDPPLDSEVVHSPVTTMPGGKPKQV